MKLIGKIGNIVFIAFVIFVIGVTNFLIPFILNDINTHVITGNSIAVSIALFVAIVVLLKYVKDAESQMLMFLSFPDDLLDEDAAFMAVKVIEQYKSEPKMQFVVACIIAGRIQNQRTLEQVIICLYEEKTDERVIQVLRDRLWTSFDTSFIWLINVVLSQGETFHVEDEAMIAAFYRKLRQATIVVGENKCFELGDFVGSYLQEKGIEGGTSADAFGRIMYHGYLIASEYGQETEIELWRQLSNGLKKSMCAAKEHAS